jgi:hypothetical protein
VPRRQSSCRDRRTAIEQLCGQFGLLRAPVRDRGFTFRTILLAVLVTTAT